jgi:hypothetical protein
MSQDRVIKDKSYKRGLVLNYSLGRKDFNHGLEKTLQQP